MVKPPRPYEVFKREYPGIWQAYDQLGTLVHDAGPLNKKDRELIKLALAIGAGMEGAVHSHTRRALEAGLKPGEIFHVALLGITTLGFPSTMAAMTWIKDEVKTRSSGKKRRKR